jgi:hypothetical protein
VSGSFEGDIVRPLGLVTLYFGYAETEIDELLESLSVLDPFEESMRQRSVGRKLSHAQNLLDRVRSDELADLKQILHEAAVLFDRRNSLVHNAIYTGTQTVSSRTSGLEQRVTPEALTNLAHEIFSCKEHINAKRQRVLTPMLIALRKSGEI